MPRVFISYRRQDSAYAAHAIYDKLTARYGLESIVFDVDTIPLGADFVEYLDNHVGRCDVLLAIIGDTWLEARGEDGSRRLDDPDDFVRIEIQAALARNIPVVPVLTGATAMPKKESLPPALQALTRRNAAEVRSGRGFQSHLELLVRGLDRIFEDAGEVPSAVASGEFVTNPLGMRLRLIPAGEFLMGSPDSDKHARDDEKPQHRVQIAQPFYLGVYAVTQQQYEKVVGVRPWQGKENVREQADSPATHVSHGNAVEFCRKLSAQEGAAYRLPTEAQWEYACRAQTTSVYSFGDNGAALREYAWYDENAWDVGEKFAHPVGQKQPNPWGLYDLHGNVWEWCADWKGGYENSSVVDPPGPASGSSRVLRGGSVGDASDYCRSAFRFSGPPNNPNFLIGFRVLRT